MLNRRKISILGTPSLCCLLISLTCNSFNLHVGCRLPLNLEGSCENNPLCRPLTTSSITLSFCVPAYRCEGLQHGGLSQLCRDKRGAGSNPNLIYSDNLFAPKLRYTPSPHFKLIYPYPLAFPASQGQHSSTDLINTFDQNLMMSESLNGGISLGVFIVHNQYTLYRAYGIAKS
jgi:hypothetical protein